MSIYASYRYLYPPRPSTKIPPESLKTFEDMGYYGQPKLNGSCCEVYTDGKQVIVKSRHKDNFARMKLDLVELKKLHRGHGWMVLVGEYLNKSKKNAQGKSLEVFVIFDIIVYNGQTLVGSTFKERLDLLDTLYESTHYDGWITKVSATVYRVVTFGTDLFDLWKKIVKIDMYEGFVLKRLTGKLEAGLNVNNNISWQVKSRKDTKNYSY